MNARLVIAVTVLSFAAPALAAGQGRGFGLSVQAGLGSHIGDGGDTESISLGVMFGGRFGAVVNVERSAVPAKVTFFQDGGVAWRF